MDNTMKRKILYGEVSRVLTDYEEGLADAENLYNTLVAIQNNWETVITAQD